MALPETDHRHIPSDRLKIFLQAAMLPLVILLCVALASARTDTGTEDTELQTKDPTQHESFSDFTIPRPIDPVKLRTGFKDQRIEFILHRWGDPPQPVLEEPREVVQEFEVSVAEHPSFIKNIRMLQKIGEAGNQAREDSEDQFVRFGKDEWQKTVQVSFDVGEKGTRGEGDFDEGDLVVLIKARDPSIFPPERKYVVPLRFRPLAEARVKIHPLSRDFEGDVVIEESWRECDKGQGRVFDVEPSYVFYKPARSLEEMFVARAIGPGDVALGRWWWVPDDPEASHFFRAGEGPAAELVARIRPRLDHRTGEVQTPAGTYRWQTRDLVVVSGTFGQPSGYKGSGEWKDEGHFELLHPAFHFQGLIVEPNVQAFHGKNIKQGKLRLLPPREEGDRQVVTLEATWIRVSSGANEDDPPVQQKTKIEVDYAFGFPESLNDPRADNFADVPIRVKAREGYVNAVQVRVFPFVPTNHVPPGRTLDPDGGGPPSMGVVRITTGGGAPGDRTLFGMEGLPWGDNMECFAEFDAEVRNYRVAHSGVPARGPGWHLRDESTKWVVPIRFKLPIEGVSGRLERYAFAVYGAKAEKYAGPLPQGPAGEAGDTVVTGQGTGTGTGTTTGTGSDVTVGTGTGIGTGVGTATVTGTGVGTATGTGTGTGSDSGTTVRTSPIDPDTLNPSDADVSRLIREWISAAEPPKNAIEGNNFHYSNKGNIVGTAASGVIESRHETGAFDPVFLWKNHRQLDSIDHCTLEEYVVARLKNEPISHCAGRYGAVKDLKGMKLGKAKAAVSGAGFECSVISGSSAGTPEQEGTVERQKPGPEQYLKKGQPLTLIVHSPYVPGITTLPDFIGEPLGEAKKWLKKNKLKMNPLQIGSSALTAEKSGTIEKQEPIPGTTVKAGSKVTLTVHTNFVDVRLMPNVIGLSATKAKTQIVGAGLEVSLESGGKPSSREQSGTVKRQHPEPGTKVKANSKVSLFVYGPYVETIAVPKLVGTSLSDAINTLQNVGLEIEPSMIGSAPDEGKAGRIKSQNPLPGSTVPPGTRVQVDLWGDYEDPGIRIPDVRNQKLADAINTLKNVGLGINPSMLGSAPDEGKAGRIKSQNPLPGSIVPPGTQVQVDLWGDYVDPGVIIPDVRGLTLADAKKTLENIGIGIEPTLLGAATNKAKALKVKSQNPLPGTTAINGTTVQVEIWGEYNEPNPCFEPTWITMNTPQPPYTFHITTPPWPGAAAYTKDGNKYWLTGTSNSSISKPREYIVINGDNLKTYDNCGKLLKTSIRTETKPWDFGQTAWLGYVVNDDGTRGAFWILVWSN